MRGEGFKKSRRPCRVRKYDERLRRLDVQSRIRDRRIEAELKARDERFDKRIKTLMDTGTKLFRKSDERLVKIDIRLAEVTEKLDALSSVVDGIIRRPSPPPA